MMKAAVRYFEYGDVSVLRYEDTDQPRPAAGQVLVRVAASSFNPIDDSIRAGQLQQVFLWSFRTRRASTSPARSPSSATGSRGSRVETR